MKFYGIESLLSNCLMNGVLNLEKIKLTSNQLIEIRDYISFQKIWRLIINKIHLENTIIVKTLNESDLIIVDNDKIISPYNIPLNNKLQLKNESLSESSDLGIDTLLKAKFVGPSASGMPLGIGTHKNIKVFIKFFPMKSNYRHLPGKNGEILIRKKVELDNNALEIGITRYLSSLLYEKVPFTQNLVTVYNYKKCHMAYESEISMSTGKKLIFKKMIDGKLHIEDVPILDAHVKNLSEISLSKSKYLISKIKNNYPQEILLGQYMEHQWDDQINYIMNEYCNGDLESLFKSSSKNFNDGFMNEIEFVKTWDSIFMQISITLYCLNEKLGGFYHNDLGLRNILFKIDNINKSTYFNYNIGETSYNIENVGLIPKIWDFSYVYVDENKAEIFKNSGFFDYLRPEDEFISMINEELPCLPQLCNNFLKFEESFKQIENTEIGKKIKKIAELDYDDYEMYFEMFNTFVVDHVKHRKLFPEFRF